MNNLKYTTDANKYNPYFVTGFCDAESCFSLNIIKNPLFKLGWKVSLVFSIHLHSKDIGLLYHIQKFFGVGNVTLHGDNSMFQITKLADLVYIIEHFKTYPLKTHKYADFVLFKKAFDIIKDKKHLTLEGLHELISIRASLNKGLPERLKLAFSSIKPIIRPEVPKLYLVYNNSNNNNWVAGFVSGEGCFLFKPVNLIHTN